MGRPPHAHKHKPGSTTHTQKRAHRGARSTRKSTHTLATSVAGRTGWKRLARPLFAEHLTSIHSRDVICHKTVVSGVFISGSSCSAAAAATTAGSSAQQQQRRLQRQRRAALGPRECAGRATVGGPRHNSNVGRIRRERAVKRGKGYKKKKKEPRRRQRRRQQGAQSVQVCVWVSSRGI